MTIGVGSRLGPYEISAKLGEGGMAEVWRARPRRGPGNRRMRVASGPQRAPRRALGPPERISEVLLVSLAAARRG